MKYPPELVKTARDWYIANTPEEGLSFTETTKEELRDYIFKYRRELRKEAKELIVYSSLEIAEMIKDIDRSS